MKLQVVSVMDRAVAAYGRPIFVQTLGAATRSFGDEITRKDPNNEMNKHPEDYDLYHLAEYDDQTGEFSNLEGGPKQIAIGKHFKAKE